MLRFVSPNDPIRSYVLLHCPDRYGNSVVATVTGKDTGHWGFAKATITISNDKLRRLSLASPDGEDVVFSLVEVLLL